VYEEIELNYKRKYGEYTIPYIEKPFKFEITSGYAEAMRKKARSISFTICFLMTVFIIVDHDK
jgi:hypothetical protein